MRPPVKRMAVYERLKRDLNQRVFKPGSFLPNEIELASFYSVGRKTMRGALAMLVDEQRVERMGPKGTYVCDIQKRPQTKAIGLVGIDNENEQSREIINLLDAEAEKHGFHIVSIGCNLRFILEHPEYLANFPADGLVFTSSSITRDLMDILKERNVPVTGVCRMEGYDDLDWMDNDHLSATHQALEYLKSLGHKRIAYIDYARMPEYQYHIDLLKNIFSESLADDFEESFFYACEDVNLLYRLYGEDYDYENSRRALNVFMANPCPPTAIVAKTGIAIQTKQCLKKFKLQVPQDVSILMVSENKMPSCNFTRIEFDRAKRLLWATRRLIEILDSGKQSTQQELCDYQLILGDSTLPL